MVLEVVVGFGIFTIALLLIFGLFTTSRKATTTSKNLAVAVDLASQVMETELALGYAAVDSRDPQVIPLTTLVDGSPVTIEYVSEVTVTTVPSGSTFSFEHKRVVVTISWSEVTGMTRQTVLETYVVD